MKNSNKAAVRIINRAMIIPPETQIIAVTGDNNAESVQFEIPRWYDGTDMGAKEAFIDLETPDGYFDRVVPNRLIDENKITLEWIVTAAHAAKNGVIKARVRVQSDGFVWQSRTGYFTVDRTFAPDGIEIPEMQIAAIDAKLAQIEDSTQAALDATKNARTAASEANSAAKAAQDVIAGIEPKQPSLQKVLIYYGYPIAINGAWSVENAVNIYKEYSMVVFGDAYNRPDHEAHADTVRIFEALAQSAPDTKIVGYVPIGLDPDWADSNLTMEELKNRVDLWRAMGVHGIFLDEFGFDYNVTRARQNEIVQYVHDKDMFVFVNSWSLPYVFSTEPMQVSWIPGFEPNPDGLAPLLGPNDYSLFENLFYTCETNGAEVTLKCASPWRIDDAYRYYNETESEYGMSYYRKFGTQIVSLDAIPSTLDVRHKNILQTISVFGARIFNIPYVAFGDERWGSTGYYHHWDIPPVDLGGKELHAVTVATKEVTNADGTKSSFPYKWSAVIEGINYAVVYEVPSSEHTQWVDGMRYACVNDVAVENAWMTIYDFQTEVADAKEASAAAAAKAEQVKNEVDAVMPTLQNAESSITKIVQDATARIDEATKAMEGAMADLETLTAGFQYVDREW